MTRKSLKGYTCSIARALDIVGDQWSMLIVKEAVLGVETFSGFHDRVGVARNILANRLEKLVEHDILVKELTGPKRFRYRLTDKGKELLPTLLVIMQWGDKWIAGADGEPVRVLDKENRAPIQKIGIVSRSGQFLELDDVLFEPGPGAKPTEQ
jgi:DNA-binding HxlR family transcriptional regulator